MAVRAAAVVLLLTSTVLAADSPAPTAATPPATATASPAPYGVARLLEDEKPPGVQILILDHGHAIVDRNIGVADLATKRPVDARTRFEIASATKQFTAAAILQLAERGKLALSDPLGKWVPEYRPGRRVTLEQLLWQVSGIPNYTDTDAYWKLVRKRGNRVVFVKNLDLRGELALIAGKPLEFHPGSYWAYSNTNYVLLAAVVAKASGTSWKTYVRSHLLVPAGMTNSGFEREPVPGGELATGYGLDRRTGKVTAVGSPAGEGDGGIVSTAHDLARWNAALFGGRIVSQRSLARMTAPGPHPEGAQGYGYGLFVDVYDGLRRISHGGTSLGYTAADAIYPSLAQQVIVLTNANWAGGGDLADAAFDDLHPQLFASSSAGAGGENPAITALVKRLWSGMVSGHVDQSLLSPRMGRFGRLAGARRSQFAVYGVDARWVYRGTRTPPHPGMSRSYTYLLLFPSGRALDLTVALTPRRKIEGVFYSRR
jgi:CubicO group peptidase (beta-lactamase class C family)